MMFKINQKGHISELVGYSGVYIGAEVAAKGEISTDEDIFIDGEFNGEITTIGAIELGKNSKFTGSIKARSVIIEGFAKGNIDADESLQISGCGHIKGSIESKKISVDPGAVINAKASTK